MTHTMERQDTLQGQRSAELPPPSPPPSSPRRMGPVRVVSFWLTAIAALALAVIVVMSGSEEPAVGDAPTAAAIRDGNIHRAAGLVVGTAESSISSLSPASELTPAQQAEAARWAGMVDALESVAIGPDGLTFIQRAEADRWTALAEALDRSPQLAVESARMTALANWTLARTPGADGLTPIQRVEADRLAGLAEFLGG